MARPALVWVTTDWHVGHARLVEAAGRPVNFWERILREHKALVAPQDTLVNLGDLILPANPTWQAVTREMLRQIPGTHVLVLGNHDRKTRTWYRELGFVLVTDGLVWDDVLLTHRPTPPPPGMTNVHGHFHQWGDNRGEFPDYDPTRQVNLALEETGYRPVELRTFVARRRRAAAAG